ncbi:MAG: ABC transporter ATP-binding protein [Armatimonadota bacterium]|nr:ABC transporter ATP-binding protein [Armatimonadota bacterium]MDR5703280.1 ABC transporter ATP-binding protein [Armatimonadota bacterium]
MPKPLIEVRETTCSYGPIPALHGVSIQIARGEFVGIVGPNGAGKSTLLRAMHALVRPREGAILIDGRQVNRLSSRELARILAGVPQEAGNPVPFTALEIVLMGRNPHRRGLSWESPQDLAIARQAMERTHTWHLADRPFQSLSGGERQRVLIARALAQRPQILLLDEPTAHLDIAYQLEIMELLTSLHREGLTILAVLHDLNLAAMFCERLILMSKGTILADGPPGDVLKPKWIRKAYGVDALIRTHPLTGRPYITLLSPSRLDPFRDAPSVHVICGGGSGAGLLSTLLHSGFRVSTGVLNVLDSDHEAAQAMGIEVIEEAPFSPISEETHRLNLLRILESDAVVITSVPFGHGNLKNLEAAVEARNRGIPVFLLGHGQGAVRDYTGGLAEDLLERLLMMGASQVESVEELLRELVELSNLRQTR